jgi:hypothetical protein
MISKDMVIFDRALGFTQSQKRDRSTGERTVVEYVDIGNNIEIDVMGYLIEQGNLFCVLHARNVEKFHENSVIDVLKQLRHFIINKTSHAEGYSKPYIDVINEIPDSELVQINTLNFDPGYTGHVDSEERKSGIKLNILGIYYPETEFTEISDKLQKNIPLKKFILDPESIYSEFVLRNVNMLNDGLAKLKNQQHIKKKMYLMMNNILSGKQKLTIEQEGNTYHIPYEWYGPIPHIKLEHDIRDNYRVTGEIELYFKHGGYKDNCGFNIHLPKELYDKMGQNDLFDFNVREKIRNQLIEKFEKANIKFYFTSYVNLNLLDY